MNRVRVEAKIDRDAMSPDSIKAAQEYLTGSMATKAEEAGVALDWSRFRTTTYQSKAEVTLVQWAPVLK